MIAGLFSVFVCASLAALIGLRNQRRQQRDFIPQTGLEWQKDRRLLDDLLVKTRDGDSRNNARTFPRSKTFRWLLTHPVGRWLGSAVLTGALYQFLFGRTLGAFLQSSKRSASAKK